MKTSLTIFLLSLSLACAAPAKDRLQEVIDSPPAPARPQVQPKPKPPVPRCTEKKRDFEHWRLRLESTRDLPRRYEPSPDLRLPKPPSAWVPPNVKWLHPRKTTVLTLFKDRVEYKGQVLSSVQEFAAAYKLAAKKGKRRDFVLKHRYRYEIWLAFDEDTPLRVAAPYLREIMLHNREVPILLQVKTPTFDAQQDALLAKDSARCPSIQALRQALQNPQKKMAAPARIEMLLQAYAGCGCEQDMLQHHDIEILRHHRGVRALRLKVTNTTSPVGTWGELLERISTPSTIPKFW